jgi:hypothetical protein
MHLPQILRFLKLPKLAAQPPKEPTVSKNNQPFIYTDEQLMARLKFFIGICLALTLTGIVFVVLYSIIFVTQPLNAISPIDQKFFELIIPIATFLTGTLSGIMLAGTKKEDQDAMLAAQKQAAANAADAAKTSAVIAPPAPSFPAPVANSWGAQPLGSGFGSAAPVPAPVVDPVWAAAPAGDVAAGWGGKAAPPPTTAWPEK